MAQLTSSNVTGNLAVTGNISIGEYVTTQLKILNQYIRVVYENPDTGAIGEEYTNISPQGLIILHRGSNTLELSASSIKINGTELEGVPTSTSSDVGKFLRVNSSGNATWESVPNAESASF